MSALPRSSLYDRASIARTYYTKDFFGSALLPLLALSAIALLIGTEIRVRIEDCLLASRFGQRFTEYQRSVPACIPFLK